MSIKPFATIRDLQSLLAAGTVSVQDILDYYRQRAQKYSHLNGILETFDTKSVMSDVASSGVLAGIPGYIKDNIAQKNRITTCGSKILEHFISPYDATVIERLKNAGAICLGRANLDEFAMGSSGETSAFGPSKNPWAVDCVPGGSSSGPAVAVAAGLAPWALGSETGGSVRHPAGMCGLVGLKPTYGALSRYGLVAYGSSLDQIGVLTKTVYDNALVYSAIAGSDEKDASSLPLPSQDYTKFLTGSLKKSLKIGLVTEAIEAQGLAPEIKKAVLEGAEVLKKQGAQIVPVSMKTLEYGAAVYFIISRAEAASNLSRFDGVRYGLRSKGNSLIDMYSNSRHDGFGKEVRARLLIGNYVLSVGHADQYYDNARRIRAAMQQEFLKMFTEVDVLLMPTNAVPAFPIGAFDNDKLAMDLQDYYTCPVNLAGIPALAFPIGMTQDEKPLSMQLVGPHNAEGLLFQIAHVYEQQTPWHTMHPNLL